MESSGNVLWGRLPSVVVRRGRVVPLLVGVRGAWVRGWGRPPRVLRLSSLRLFLRALRLEVMLVVLLLLLRLLMLRVLRLTFAVMHHHMFPLFLLLLLLNRVHHRTAPERRRWMPPLATIKPHLMG